MSYQHGSPMFCSPNDMNPAILATTLSYNNVSALETVDHGFMLLKAWSKLNFFFCVIESDILYSKGENDKYSDLSVKNEKWKLKIDYEFILCSYFLSSHR